MKRSVVQAIVRGFVLLSAVAYFPRSIETGIEVTVLLTLTQPSQVVVEDDEWRR